MSIPKYGEAPISVSGIGDGYVDLTIRRVGKVTDEVFERYVAIHCICGGLGKCGHCKIGKTYICLDGPETGYPASGTRNISACIGNRVCPYACYDTTSFARRIEKAVFPNDLNFKIALTGCPNDCAKVRMHDFGIMGMTLPRLESDRCVSCGACISACTRKSSGALRKVNYRPARDEKTCIGCGECILSCPNMAWTRSEKNITA